MKIEREMKVIEGKKKQYNDRQQVKRGNRNWAEED